MRWSLLSALGDELPGVPVRSWVAAALLLHVLSAWFHGGFLNVDEHFQIIEFAWYKLGHAPASALPWEFAARMRPAIQPLLAAGVIKGLDLVGAFTPFFAAFVLRTVSTLLALWVTLELCARCLPLLTRPPLKLLVFAGSLFLWIAPCLHSRFSSENWGGLWLFAGICLVLDSLAAWPASRRQALVLGAAAGAAWGVSFFCRFQVGFALAGIGAWLVAVRRAPVRLVATIVLAGLAVTCLNVSADHWLYDAWVFTPANYLQANLLAGKAATFGTAPLFVTAVPFLIILIPPYSIALAAAMTCGVWYCRRHILVWTVVPFVVAHALVAHKEARFMTPMIYGLVPLLALSLEALPTRIVGPWVRWTRSLAGRVNVGVFCAANVVALLTLTFVPINDRDRMFTWLWNESRVSPITLYSASGSPYEHERPMNFYRAPGVRVVPLSSSVEGPRMKFEAGERAFVFYEGFDPPRSLLPSSAACVPMVRTVPRWAVRLDMFGWLSGAVVWTICQPTSSSVTLAPDSHHPASPSPSRD
jgi:phosphatidylinositol glycan class B